MTAWVAVLNCGSSSIKFALFDAARSPLPRTPPWSGKVEGIGGADATYQDTDTPATSIALEEADPYHAALARIRERMRERIGGGQLAAVAHRVVHGGARYFQPARIDAQVLADLRSYIPLAPLHQPFALEAIDVLLRERPDIPQVACFDTAFHHTLPDVEKVLPLTADAWEKGLRRYGFHGLSYEYLAIALAERHGAHARGRTLCAHLGSGASLCAMDDLRSVATTMGFSALDGLMMGTRCGTLDPGVVLYLLESEKLSAHELGQLLYHRAGLLGLSGVSADLRELLPRETADERVALAIALYVRRIVREIGAMVAVLGGLDLLVFSAGVGEHNPTIRERVCRGLSAFGIVLDGDANAANAPVISSPDSRVRVAVEPTNEEWIAARDALAVVR
ncbi:acetate/propionate family kinase [Dyella sp. BiH032]|uniref:acetate/propionate family kinase n=1 Tax=Dyella sp. BiH032 TaxID=3075430 RepID=UPI002892BF0D|nr:acetate/propionate family kinase [Dyella sp. BiH032]WNL44153.1 acetate/propionate family kinase [Dyella sp. BiH032]